VQSNIYDFLRDRKKVEQRFKVIGGFVSHPLVRENSILAKDFQLNIASSSMESSTLVVLPTGMGKTIIAILITAEKLSKTDGKILMVSPTRPLTEQHFHSFKKFLRTEGMVMFSGSVKPAKRTEEWKKARIVFSTPQTINNDLEKERYDLSDLSLLILDEAHGSVGDYTYTGILSHYNGHVPPLEETAIRSRRSSRTWAWTTSR
jgi:ERCC4-related helicase